MLERELRDPRVVMPKQGPLRAHNRLGACRNRSVERRWKLFRTSYVDNLELNTELASRGLHVLHDKILEASWLAKHGEPRGLWNHFLEELHSFRHQLGRNVRDAGDVAARTNEAGDDCRFDRVEARRQHDWNCRGRFLYDCRRRSRRRNDKVNLHLDEFSGEARESVGTIFRPAGLDDICAPLNVSQLGEADSNLVKAAGTVRGVERENADFGGLWLLRPGDGKKCCEQSANDETEVVASIYHLITSSTLILWPQVVTDGPIQTASDGLPPNEPS